MKSPSSGRHQSVKSWGCGGKAPVPYIGNAGAYGPLVELNEQTEGKDIKLVVYSGEHYHEQSTREREVPGEFYFPPIASLITSGGRRLLALAQKCVEDAGGKILFCDTDSLCIVANEKGGFFRGGAHTDLGYAQGADMQEFAPVPCLSRDTVLKISERYASLNPIQLRRNYSQSGRCELRGWRPTQAIP